MKKVWLIRSCLAFFVILVLLLGACGGSGSTGGGSTSSTPAIAKVRLWLTLSNNPDATQVTTLTPEQTVQASIWARGTTEENLTIKVNLTYNDQSHNPGDRRPNRRQRQGGRHRWFCCPAGAGRIYFPGHFRRLREYHRLTDFTVAPATAESPPPATPPVSTLPEQPDKATFQKYFFDMGLGRLPADAKSPQELQQNVATFTAGDQLTLYGTVIQEVQISARYYNVATKQSADAGGSPDTPEGWRIC